MRRIFLFDNIEQAFECAGINKTDFSFINVDDLRCNCPRDLSWIDLNKDVDKTLFERRYLDLIASLGSQNKTIYWWAGCLSEKNPLNSKLFERLYKMICFNNIITKIESNIMVICSDEVLKEQIILNYRKEYIVNCGRRNRYRYYFKNVVCKIKGIFSQLSTAVRECGKLLLCRILLRNKKSLINNKDNYIVIRTWVDHRNYKDKTYEDSYFKSLPGFLSSHDEKVVTFAGIISDYKKIIARFKNDSGNLIIPTNLYIKITDIFRCLFSTYFSRPRIETNITLDNVDVTFLFCAETSKDIIGTSFFGNLMNYYYCLRLAQAIDVKTFIYTFENYAWEKMSILGIRKASSKAVIIGFQHAFVSKNSFKYFPGSGEEKIIPLPDKIVTMGRQTQEIMRRLGSYPNSIFSTGCALRQEYIFSLNELPRNQNGGIFVPLTITVNDSVKVFQFLFKAGLDGSHEEVYFRFHPATPVKTVLSNLGFCLPENFIISDNPPMQKEIERCSVVLYTWTTVCLEALKMGRPVIYLDVNYPLEVDPLFECLSLKDVCRDPGELAAKIKRIRSLDNNRFRLELKQAQSYLDEYFIPVNKDNLSVFIR